MTSAEGRATKEVIEVPSVYIRSHSRRAFLASTGSQKYYRSTRVRTHYLYINWLWISIHTWADPPAHQGKLNIPRMHGNDNETEHIRDGCHRTDLEITVYVGSSGLFSIKLQHNNAGLRFLTLATGSDTPVGPTTPCAHSCTP